MQNIFKVINYLKLFISGKKKRDRKGRYLDISTRLVKREGQCKQMQSKNVERMWSKRISKTKLCYLRKILSQH